MSSSPTYSFTYPSDKWVCQTGDCRFQSKSMTNGSAAERLAFEHVEATAHTVYYEVKQQRWLAVEPVIES